MFERWGRKAHEHCPVSVDAFSSCVNVDIRSSRTYCTKFKDLSFFLSSVFQESVMKRCAHAYTSYCATFVFTNDANQEPAQVNGNRKDTINEILFEWTFSHGKQSGTLSMIYRYNVHVTIQCKLRTGTFFEKQWSTFVVSTLEESRATIVWGQIDWKKWQYSSIPHNSWINKQPLQMYKQLNDLRYE